MQPPLPVTYWAAPNQLLAGPALATDDRERVRHQLRALLDAGVRTIVDLRTAAEGPDTRVLLTKLARDADTVAWIGLPILNGDAPSPALLELALDTIDASIARGRAVYVHCAGGRGRTGTIVACWWIRHGVIEADAATDALARARAHLPDAPLPSPETAAQLRLVRSWRRGR
ncbi:MAG: dual specificity protein phosphatase family protein [Nannocystaceae bacterium]|nr:dual specificity protein phosphatase family protein [Nannocystaceae bacterium]